MRAIVARSRPARALWIEILSWWNDSHEHGSRPARALWIEIVISEMVLDGVECRGPRGPCGLKYRNFLSLILPAVLSRPARALWIEI